MTKEPWYQWSDRPNWRRKEPKRDVFEPTQLLSDDRDAGKVFEIIRNKHHMVILFCDHVPKSGAFRNPVYVSSIAWAKEHGADLIIFFDRARRRLIAKSISALPDPEDRYFDAKYEMAYDANLPHSAPWFDVPTCSRTVELFVRDPRETGTQPNLLGE